MAEHSKCLIIIPFQKAEGKNFEETREHVNSMFSSQSSTLSCPKEKLIEQSKYYDFITQSFKFGMTDRGIFSIFHFDLGQLSDQKGLSFHDKFQDCTFFLDTEFNIQVRFNECWILLNPITDLGYVIFELNFKFKEGNSLEKLSNQKIFRFFNLENELRKNTERKKYSFKLVKDGQLNGYVCLHEIMKDFVFRQELSNISFYHSKPLQVHFLEHLNFSLSENEISDYCYKILRVPGNTAVNDKEKSLSKSSRNPDSLYTDSTFVYTLNEGAVVIDTLKTLDEMMAAYTPAFLLALNQRETVLLANKEIVMNPVLHMSSKDFELDDLSQLEDLSKNINTVRLTQFFYSVSVYTEIDNFFKLTQEKFRVDVLLNDVNESVSGVKNILQQEKDRKENDRSKLVALILSIIGISGFLSFIVDYLTFKGTIPDLFNYPQKILLYIGIIMCFVITLLFYYKQIKRYLKLRWKLN